MGGSGGGQKSESKAEYAEEFKPLATSAVKEIQALQNALPLASHTQFQPAGVAGLSPIEQFTINELVMRTPYLPSTFESLMELPEPVGAASKSAAKAGEGSQGAAGALDFLSDFLGRDVRPTPTVSQPFPTLTRLPTPETAFPGLSKATVEAARPGIATQPTPMAQPIPSAPSLPPPVAAPAPVPQGPATTELASQIAAMQIRASLSSPTAQHFYDRLVAGGMPPEQAAMEAEAVAWSYENAGG